MSNSELLTIICVCGLCQSKSGMSERASKQATNQPTNQTNKQTNKQTISLLYVENLPPTDLLPLI